MTVSYVEVFEVLGPIGIKHPQTVSLLWQTYGLVNPYLDEFKQFISQYNKTAETANGTIDKAAILLQLMDMHPNVSDILKKVIIMWQTRIPDLLQIIDELQDGATSVGKT